MQAEILSNNEGNRPLRKKKGAFISLQNNRPIPIPEELENKYLEFQQVNQII